MPKLTWSNIPGQCNHERPTRWWTMWTGGKHRESKRNCTLRSFHGTDFGLATTTWSRGPMVPVCFAQTVRQLTVSFPVFPLDGRNCGRLETTRLGAKLETRGLEAWRPGGLEAWRPRAVAKQKRHSLTKQSRGIARMRHNLSQKPEGNMSR